MIVDSALLEASFAFASGGSYPRRHYRNHDYQGRTRIRNIPVLSGSPLETQGYHEYGIRNLLRPFRILSCLFVQYHVE